MSRKAAALFVVVTPRGHVSDGAAFSEEEATRRYLERWLPDGVKPTGYVMDQLWQSFANAGYRCVKIDLPKNVEGKPICAT